MPPAKNCPQCGTNVRDELPGGLCPTCLMEVAQRSQPASSPAPGTDGGTLAPPTLEQMTALFPEYDVTEMIGRGGMGAVYRATHRKLERSVAIKVFLFRPDDPEFAQRFAREARTLARLDHPHIVRVYDFGERAHLHFLAMEYVDGLNLREVAASAPMPPREAMALIPQLCDAIQFAHDRGVVHRDIKPENILLSREGQLKIADFGLAKITGTPDNIALTRTRQVMGTMNYMAPEQMERPTEVDHRADIYSLGVVIYELLTGELPIGRFPPPSRKVAIDVRLDEVVLRALEKEPALRYQHASDLKTDLTGVDFPPPASPRSADAAAARAAPIAPGQPIKPPAANPPSPIPRTPREWIPILLGSAAMFLCLVLCPLLIVAGIEDVRLLPEEPSRYAGIVAGILGGWLFAIGGSVRVLLQLPPRDKDDLKDYHATSPWGAGLRILALSFGFGAGIVMVSYGLLSKDNGILLFVGISCGIACAACFVAAGAVDELLKPDQTGV